jgi:molybdopterin-biosynthesis enzyme MoeA-like protein
MSPDAVLIFGDGLLKGRTRTSCIQKFASLRAENGVKLTKSRRALALP